MRDKLQRTLAQYASRRVPAFEVKVYGLLAEQDDPSGFAMDARWPSEYPHGKRRGVYLMYSRSGRPLYVGKASQEPIGARLECYFRTDANGACIAIGNWTEPPAYLLTVAVPDEFWFEASALEEYLIWILKPCDNIRGVAACA